MASWGPVTNPLWGTVGCEVARMAVIQRSVAKPHSGKTSSHTAPLSPGTVPASLPTPKPRQEKQVAPGSALIRPDCHCDQPADLGCHLHPRSRRRDHPGPPSGAEPSGAGAGSPVPALPLFHWLCWMVWIHQSWWSTWQRWVWGLPGAGIPNFLRSPIFWDAQFFGIPNFLLKPWKH